MKKENNYTYDDISGMVKDITHWYSESDGEQNARWMRKFRKEHGIPESFESLDSFIKYFFVTIGESTQENKDNKIYAFVERMASWIYSDETENDKIFFEITIYDNLSEDGCDVILRLQYSVNVPLKYDREYIDKMLYDNYIDFDDKMMDRVKIFKRSEKIDKFLEI